MERGSTYLVVILGVFMLIIISSGRCKQKDQYKYQKEGLDKVIEKNSHLSDFTVILKDMDYQDKYKHQYQVVYPKSDTTFDTKTTQWYEVSDRFFKQNLNNLGMEIASKKDGKLTKNVAPAGYSNYVGNEKYGTWRQRNGSSFWEFYGKYAMLSSIFNMATFPARQSYWNNYYSSYRNSGRDYYGPSGYYGTKNYVNKTSSGRNTSWGAKPQSFRERVRSRVNKSSSSRIRRSGSRYSGGSNYRSRSGGFGK